MCVCVCLSVCLAVWQSGCLAVSVCVCVSVSSYSLSFLLLLPCVLLTQIITAGRWDVREPGASRASPSPTFIPTHWPI